VERIDRYVIERAIGDGVYAAHDPELARDVTIRIVRGDAARFRRLAKLEHPNVVAVYDVGEHAGDTFVAMARVDGTSLRDWLAAPRSRKVILGAMRDAARGLAAVHAAGLAHGALEAEHVIVGNDGVVRVAELGLGDDPAADRKRLCAIARDALGDRAPAALAREYASTDSLVAVLAPPRRRWPWIAGGVAVVAGAIGFAVIPRSVEAPCADTDRELETAWPASIDTGARQLLDSYAGEWRAERHAACVADSVARTRCLGLAKDALASLIRGVAADTDPDRLHTAILALPSPGDCRTPPAEVSQQQLAEGHVLDSKLANLETHALLEGGTSLDVIRPLDEQARRLGYEPAIVRGALAMSHALARSGQHEAAADELRPALTVAENAHDDLAVARLASELATVLTAIGKLDEARALADLAVAAAKRVGGDPRIELVITDARAHIAAAAGDHDTAIALTRSLIEPMTRRTGEHSEEVARLYMMLSREYAAAGRLDDAREAADHARLDDLARAKASPGINLVVLTNRGNQALLAGDVDHAITLARELVALAREVGDRAMQTDAALTLAQTYDIARDGPMMVASYQAVLDGLDAPARTEPQPRTDAYEGIGRGYILSGDYARSLEPLREALALANAGGPALAVSRRTITLSLARSLLELGKPGEARTLVEPVFRELDGDPASLPAQRGNAELYLARALWETGDDHDRAHAKTLAQDALRHYRQALDTAGVPPIRAEFERRLGQVTTWLQRHDK
jgi:tetratricopeptide (TPR) repeat protein